MLWLGKRKWLFSLWVVDLWPILPVFVFVARNLWGETFYFVGTCSPRVVPMLQWNRCLVCRFGSDWNGLVVNIFGFKVWKSSALKYLAMPLKMRDSLVVASGFLWMIGKGGGRTPKVSWWLIAQKYFYAALPWQLEDNSNYYENIYDRREILKYLLKNVKIASLKINATRECVTCRSSTHAQQTRQFFVWILHRGRLFFIGSVIQ